MSFLGKLHGQKKGREQSGAPPAASPQTAPSVVAGFYLPGACIGGRYEVASRPLLGGMGIVYLCNDLQESRPVALKSFRPEYLPDRAARDRFLREGTHWVDLGAHPNIVHCYRVFRPEATLEVYLVLELIAKAKDHADASLRSWLVAGKPLPVETALLFALQIAWGLQHATQVIPSLVHRDLKPENLLVGADYLPGTNVNRLRVTDFGLASVLEEGRHSAPTYQQQAMIYEPLTAALGRTQLTHGIVGTPLYMAPEQWREEPVSVSTDVYALGCILYEMLVGQQAVTGHNLVALEQAHCTGAVRPLPASLPVAVRSLVAQCLDQDPRVRHASWVAMTTALANALEEVTGRAAPPLPGAADIGKAEDVATGWSYNEIGAAYLDLGKSEVARSYFERGVAAGRKTGERLLEGIALNNLGLAYDNLGDLPQAIRCYEDAYAISREAGARHVEVDILGNLGNAFADLGDAPQAMAYYEQVLAIYHILGDRPGRARALINLGLACQELGDVRKAIDYSEQGLAIARQIQEWRVQLSVLGNLGRMHRQLGDTRKAIGYFEQSLAIAHEIGDRRGEGNALGNLGFAYTDLGDYGRATECLEQALAAHHETGDRMAVGIALCAVGVIYEKLGNARRAIGYYDQALKIACETGNRREEEVALGNLGNAYLQLGDTQQAISCYQRALAIDHEIGDLQSAATDTYNLAVLYVRQGEISQALALAQQAAEIWARIDSPSAEQAQQLIGLCRRLTR